jgi:CheY-like chemotaxis protein
MVMKKILVVDDDEILRTAIIRALHGEGYETIEAADGDSAVGLAQQHIPALIISDVWMDNANGFMVREILRDNPATASIPMILMTGIADNAGAWGSDPDVGYLTKPFSIEELVALVRTCLTR